MTQDKKIDTTHAGEINTIWAGERQFNYSIQIINGRHALSKNENNRHSRQH